MCLRKYLNEEALENLKNYKYVSGEYSPMDKCLTPFWNWSVELLPEWMAPNLVTFIGMLLTQGVMFLYFPEDLTLTKTYPFWVYIVTAISFFIA